MVRKAVANAMERRSLGEEIRNNGQALHVNYVDYH